MILPFLSKLPRIFNSHLHILIINAFKIYRTVENLVEVRSFEKVCPKR